MSLTIGRVSLSSVESWSMSGDMLALSGTYAGSGSSDAAKAGDCQAVLAGLNGLVDNPDEPHVPVAWSTESTVDGFYAVESVSTDLVNTGASRGVFATWSVSLRRVASLATVESDVLAQVRTNGHAVASAVGVVGAFPLLVDGGTFNYTTSFSSTSEDQYTGADTSLKALVKTISAATTGTVGVAYTAANWYKNACTIEWKADGTNYSKVVGREIPAGAAGTLRLSNGLIRITLSGGAATVEGYSDDSNAWESNTFKMHAGAGPSAYNIGGQDSGTAAVPVIFRNDPDCVIVRTVQFAAGVRMVETFTLRRGHRFVEMTFTPATALAMGLRFENATTTVDLATATAGIVSSAADANDNKWLLMSASSTTNNNVSGRIIVASTALPTTFAIGVLVDISSTSFTAAQILDQFLVVVDCKTRLVLP